MCGISGIYNLNTESIDPKVLMEFTDSMLHRGPDASGYELLDQNSLGLGQRRLSILDLSQSGKQPMYYAEGRFCITYNGEIFNFLSIREELKSFGHQFKSDSDTEVILAAYMQWGPLCLKKFNGMWAMAIWDELNKELFLARDRFGIKPLYYIHEEGKRFIFASETRAFKFLKSYSRRLNQHLLNLNLADPYAIEGLGYTIFDNILQLLPGHFMIVKRNEKVVQRRWWDINDCKAEVPNSFEEQAEKFYEIFRDACRLRLISDVPVGTALSGGLDSTAVYSTVYDIIQNESLGRVNKDAQRAFTATFKGLAHDEKEYAALAAAYTGGPITFLESDPYNLASRVERETELCDFINNAPISSISSVYEGMRKNGIIVSMDGHGVDEMLYGYRDMVYSLYNHALWNGSYESAKSYESVLVELYHPHQRDKVKTRFQKQLSEKHQRESSLKFKLKRVIKKGDKNLDYLPVELPPLSDKPYDFSAKSVDERMVYNEFFQHTLPALLRNFDRAGMINSVEIRMPFMDWRLVSYIFSLPVSSKIGNGFTKKIVRQAMKGRMEESLRTRTYKVGIGSPVEHWLNGSLKEWAMDTIDDKLIKAEAELSLKNGDTWSAKQVKDIWQSINLKLIN